MANFEGTTASNGARIVEGKEAELQEIISRYGFGECSCDIQNTAGGKELHIWGYDWLDIQHTDADYEDGGHDPCGEEFYQLIAPFLVEPLVIQCIGAENCRFPLSAMEVQVRPSGAIEWNQFKFDCGE